ncbi:outer membrane protein transport protein [Myroides odoratimimus]|uniref:Transporter n=1 Tax=Myroides odoratimimus TaxID=76832 RepID=A0AAI8G4N9_9FLAO|nr:MULTISPECIES: outer membrane protein transport protein [Myroides]ALU26165.1 transporter [Myroides odoratimimus]APA92207.1 transporter [Myroides sp. ZB35]MCS7471755.1 outer membrane protein transport protein [Myroides odoratimimus]MDM1032884.1 outer membrane protein transport protein [Myroides odoratimimus]MDM1037341.1 outer membrane protein transport protein [Myroides odoratimimus]
MIRKILSLSLLTLISTSAFAGGYRVAMQGNKQLAMGHTGVAVISSGAESLFFNPAASVYLEDKFNFSGGVSVLVADTKFQNKTYGWENETRNPGTPFYAYGTYKATDWMTVGLAIYSPYGSKVEWDKDWQGSHLVNNIDLKAIYFQPTVAIKVSKHFSFGGGPIFVNGGVTFNKNLSRSMTDEQGNRTNVTVEAKNVTAWGWTAGYMVNVDDHLRLGLNYRSKIVMDEKSGKSKFYDVPGYGQGLFKNGKIKAEMPLPAELAVGASYTWDKWLFAFDYNRTFWNAYKALEIEFVDNPTIGTSVNPRNYKDSSTYRLGLQYTMNDQLTLRAGWYYDESPVQEGYFAPETPRNDSRAYTGGFSYKFKNGIAIDMSLTYLHFSDTNSSYDYFMEDGQNVSFGGTYKSSVISGGLGVSYSF